MAAYAFYEPHRYRLVSRAVSTRPGTPPLTILHLSDTHFTGRNRRLAAFLKELPDRLQEPPDLVLATGDLLEGEAGIDELVGLLARLEARLGRFYVLGSHDYFVAKGPSYSKYFTGGRPKRQPARADTPRFERGLVDKGWVSLTNRAEKIETREGIVRLTGVDDPYLRWHRTDHIMRARDDSMAIGLVHAPDVVSEWMLNGYDLVLAGHTHGGQVRIPGFGALVTNCTVPTGLASGLHRVGRGWLHVSPGLGTGRFSPIRFACLPEVTLLRLVPGGLHDAGP
jgi:predicted MPP superfamily phosphohydrolase